MLSTPIYSTNDKIFGWVNGFLLLIFSLSVLYPIIYVISVSISSGISVTSGKVLLLPHDINFSAYLEIFKDKLFWMSYANTFFYTIFGTLTSLLFIIPGAYALSKARLRGRRVIGFFIAFTMWFQAGLIPTFLNIESLNLLDSRFGILIVFACNAFNVILMRNFFESISHEYEESAHLEGANDFQILWHIFIPLAKPAIATITLLCAIGRWNGYFWAMVILRSEEKIPLQVYLKKMVVEVSVNESSAGILAGGSTFSMETIVASIIVMSMIPVLLIFPIVQKYFTKGIMLGGIKE
jgi:putative aldouronate transport system permease protein